MRASTNEIEQAISYLIRISQLDNYDIQQKIIIAKYIKSRQTEVVATEIHTRYFQGEFKPAEVLEGSYIEVRPKSIETTIPGGSNAANTPPVLARFSDYIYYFRLSFVAQVCEILWIMKFGKILDEKVSKNAYANRLCLDGDYLFQHYWGQYRKWRDRGFSHDLLTSTKSHKSIISLDISKCYNSIFVENLDKAKSSKFPRHIWNMYSSLIGKYNKKLAGTLPIGPLSSGIYANLVLNEFDTKVESDPSVLYYGRYVDDILIVCNRAKGASAPLDQFAQKDDDAYFITSNGNRFSFNKDKTRIYDYDLAHPMNTFAVFKRLIEDNSSEWRLAPDQELSEIHFSKAISSISSEYSVNKPRSFAEIKIDYKELKNQLTKYLIEISAIDKLSKMESEEIVRGLSFAFSGGNTIKYYELWPTLFSVLRFLPSEHAIIKIADSAVNNLDIKDGDVSQKECIKFLRGHVLAAYVFASANLRDGVNRDTFGKLKQPLVRGLNLIASERNIKQILFLNLERRLLFNKAKTFEECVNRFKIDLIDLSEASVGETTKDEISTHAINLKSTEIGRHSKIKVSLAHVKVITASVQDAIKGTRKASIYDFKKIIRPINDAVSSRAHLLCFPEVSVPERLLSLVITYANLKGIAIVAGVEHCKYNGILGNFLVFIQPTKGGMQIFARPKIHYAPSENKMIRKNKISRVWTTSRFPVISYRNTAISVFNCFELADIRLRGLIKGKVDAIVGLEFNYDLKYFSNIMESLCRDIHAYCIQSNAGQIGENRIIAPVESHHADLIRFKAGLDPMAITSSIDVYNLREFHKDGSIMYDRNNDIEFRKLPPGFYKEE